MNIIEAVRRNDIGEVRRCIARNEDVNAKDNDGWPALMLASLYGHQDIAELLLRSGANVNAKDNDGDTALMLASGHGHPDIAELLLRSGADVNAKDDYGNTALMWASYNGYLDITERIVSVAMSDPCVPYTTVALSSFVPRCRYMNAQDYAGLVAKVIPLYTERAVKNATFGRDMQRDVEEILGRKTDEDRKLLTDEDRKLLTKKDTVLLTKLLKILRSIDYTEFRAGQESDEKASPAYDMEL